MRLARCPTNRRRHLQPGAVTLTNSTVAGNRAGGSGGGVYHFGNGLAIAGSVITSNTTGYYGGGVYVGASVGAQARGKGQ